VSNDLVRHKALRLMLTTSYTQAEIAKRCGVSGHTMSDWAKKGGWADLRAASKVTTGEIKTGMMMELEELRQLIQSRPRGERLATRDESARRNDILLGINRLKNPLTQEVIQTFSLDIAEFCGENDPALGFVAMKLFDAFISRFLNPDHVAPTLQEALSGTGLKAVRLDDGMDHFAGYVHSRPVVRPVSVQAKREEEEDEEGEFRSGLVYNAETDEWE
jgi:hypothetical protein